MWQWICDGWCYKSTVSVNKIDVIPVVLTYVVSCKKGDMMSKVLTGSVSGVIPCDNEYVMLVVIACSVPCDNGCVA